MVVYSRLLRSNSDEWDGLFITPTNQRNREYSDDISDDSEKEVEAYQREFQPYSSMDEVINSPGFSTLNITTTRPMSI